MHCSFVSARVPEQHESIKLATIHLLTADFFMVRSPFSFRSRCFLQHSPIASDTSLDRFPRSIQSKIYRVLLSHVGCPTRRRHFVANLWRGSMGSRLKGAQILSARGG